MTLHAAGISPDSYTAFGNIATGHYTGDASGAITVALGFTPVWVKVIDMSATTSPTVWEWLLGMAATDTILETQAAPQPVIDATSLIISNGALVSATEPGVYAQGTQSADDGTIINTTVSVYSPDKTKADLTFATGLNTSLHLYVWIAIG